MPTPIDEITEAQVWLLSRLTASSALATVVGTNIYSHPVTNRDIAPPYVTYDDLTSRDEKVIGDSILWTEIPFLITAICWQNDQLILQPAVTAIHAALHLQFGQTTNAQIIGCFRERPFSSLDEIDSITYSRKGAVYIVRIRSLT